MFWSYSYPATDDARLLILFLRLCCRLPMPRLRVIWSCARPTRTSCLNTASPWAWRTTQQPTALVCCWPAEYVWTCLCILVLFVPEPSGIHVDPQCRLTMVPSMKLNNCPQKKEAWLHEQTCRKQNLSAADPNVDLQSQTCFQFCVLSCWTSLAWTKCTKARWRWRVTSSMWRASTVSQALSPATWMLGSREPPQATRCSGP